MAGVRLTPADLKAVLQRPGYAVLGDDAPAEQGKTEARSGVDAEMRRRLENRFAAMWDQLGGPTDYVRNLRFDEPDSGMEFDFAWPALRFAVEVNGGQHLGRKSGHGSAKGLRRDARKGNAAQAKGWRLCVLTSDMITWEGVAEVLEQMRAQA